LNETENHLWSGTDYWTACERGLVEAPERRAMILLRQVCDKYRVDVYCACGGLAARGNITGKTYIINRRFGVDELHDGEVIANYCIAIEDIRVPRTDSVAVVKQMIEGEEFTFCRLANRFGPHMSPGRVLNFPHPFHASLLRPEDKEALNLDHKKDEYILWLKKMMPQTADQWESAGSPTRTRLRLIEAINQAVTEKIATQNESLLDDGTQKPFDCAYARPYYGRVHPGLPWI